MHSGEMPGMPVRESWFRDPCREPMVENLIEEERVTVVAIYPTYAIGWCDVIHTITQPMIKDPGGLIRKVPFQS
jgi:hypothetical protein